MQQTFENALGRGVKLAIIDDALSRSSPYVGQVEEGIHIKLDADGRVLSAPDWLCDSPSSHGTICLSVILQRAPEVKVFWARILDEQGYAHPLALSAAIEWAITKGVHLISMSLGTTDLTFSEELRRQCMRAAQAGIIQIAAAHQRALASYPSVFPEVIAVGSDARYKKYEFGFFPGHLAEFVAAGVAEDTRSFVGNGQPGKSTTHILRGTSISAARMAANAAALFEIAPGLDSAAFRDRLAGFESKLPARMQRQSTTSGATSIIQPRPDAHLARQKIAVFPLNESTESLITFRDQFPFTCNFAVDTVHTTTADAGLVFGSVETGVPLLPSLEKLPAEAETLVIGDLEPFRRADREDALLQTLEWCLENGRNAYVLHAGQSVVYRKGFEEAKARGLYFGSARDVAHEVMSQPVGYKESNTTGPVVGVFGTSFNQGKFATQMGLRRFLSKAGYKTAVIGTNPLCSVLEHGFYVPVNQDWWAVPDGHRIAFAEAVLTHASEEKPHVTIIGSGGPVAPVYMYGVNAKAFEGYPISYSLPALTMLMATKPDAVILAVNSIDQESYIRRSIAAIESLSDARVIALTVSEKLVHRYPYTYQQASGRGLLPEELETLRTTLQEKFNLPIYCCDIQEEQAELAKLVLNSFAVE